MKYFFFAVFAVSSAIHLYASYKDNKPLRNKTKGFIVSGLLGWYCFAAPEILPVVVIALAASWLGDVLLIPKGVKWFTAGGISFMVSHIFFVITYSRFTDFPAIPVWAIILAAAAYFTLTMLIFKGLKDYLPKPLFYPMMVYLLINGTMNCFALFQLISNPVPAAIVTFIGALLFFASDSLLFYVRFKKNSVWKSHFPVMLTYIVAELLIVTGILMNQALCIII